jgi:hypothetical protein
MQDRPDLKHLPIIAIFGIGSILLLASFFFAGFGDWNTKNLYRYSTASLLLVCILPYIIRISTIDVASLVSFNRRILRPYHAHLGTIAFGIAILHGLFEGRCNPLIEVSMFLFSFLLVTGLALYVRTLPPESKRRAYMLHSHFLLVFILLLLVIIGHLIEEFE